MRSGRPGCWAGGARVWGAEARVDCGLIALEWLLVVAAIAGLGASSVLVVQRVLDDASELPDRPEVRLIDADILAAFVAADAQTVYERDPSAYIDGTFSSRCEGLQAAFEQVVGAMWHGPGPGAPARCVLTPAVDLGG